MRFLTVILCLLFSNGLSAQQLEFSTGLVRNHFYRFNDNIPGKNARFQPAWGYSLGVGLRDVLLEGKKIDLYLRYENIRGDFLVQSNGRGGGISVSGSSRKSTLGLDVLPLHFIFNRSLRIGVGIESRFLLDEFTTQQRHARLGASSSQQNRHSDEERLSAPVTFGFILRAEQRIVQTDRLFLKSYLRGGLGLGKEFVDLPLFFGSARAEIGFFLGLTVG